MYAENVDILVVLFSYREQCIEVFFYQFYALLKADPYNISFLSGKVTTSIGLSIMLSSNLSFIMCNIHVHVHV